MSSRSILALAMLAVSCGSPPPPPASPTLHDIAGQAGIAFTHEPGAKGEFFLPEIMGSGCALFDADGDGDLDALLLQGVESQPHRLYRNEGAGRPFTDITVSSGIASLGRGMGAATGDFDNDGRTDLLVTAFGPTVLYRNEGAGRFRAQQTLLDGVWATSAAFVDYDRDGWQDLAILNYVDYSFAANKRCMAPTGELDYCTPRVYRPLPARLFRNVRGQFTEVRGAFTAALGPGLGIVPMDVNADGWPDLFVANDSMANHLWINQRGAGFVEKALEFGVAYGEEGLAKAGMGVAPADYDNDGDEDVVVLNLMREGATLFRAEKGDFTDVSLASGIRPATFQFTGFGVGWMDVDRDGHLDLFLANGAVTRREEQRGQPYPFAERNLLLRSSGDGKFAALPGLETAGVGRGAAFGDIDGDGDVDILINMNRGQARLLRNESPPGNWLAVDAPSGERVQLRTAGQPVQTRWARSSGSYLSASDPRVYFTVNGAIERLSVGERTLPAQHLNQVVLAGER